MDISGFKQAMAGGGARPSLYFVQIMPPSGITGNVGTDGANFISFMAQTASIPAGTIGMIEVPYMGRKVKMAGDRTYEDWNTTIVNDEGFTVRNYIETWQELINGPVSNVTSAATYDAYTSVAHVVHLAKDGQKIAEYAMQDCWPSTLAAIELGWETTDSLETFDVTWTFNQWVNLNGPAATGANFGGSSDITPVVNAMKDVASRKIRSMLDLVAGS